MANLRNIQYADPKTGLTFIGRVVRGADLYYFDFVTGGNTFLAADSANTRISMPARPTPQNYIYESATFDIEPWDDGYYEWQVYDTIPTPANGKLFALARYYISNGQIMFDDYLVGIDTGVTGIKAKTDNLPASPASEDNATSNKNEIIAEVNETEGKVDVVEGKVDVIDGNVDAIKTQTDKINFDPSDNVQARVADKGILNDPPTSEIADAVLDEQLSGHTATGSLGKAITDVEADTNETQGKLPINKIMGSSDGSDKDGEIDQIKANTDPLPSDPASQSLVESAISNSETNIRERTDRLPDDPASESQATTNKNEILTEVADIPDQVWDEDIVDTQQPTIVEQARYWLGLINAIMRKQ